MKIIKHVQKLFSYSDYLIGAVLICMLLSILCSWALLPYQGMADNRVKIYGTKHVNIEKVTKLLSQSPIKGNQSVHFFLVPRWVMVLINPIQGFKAQGVNISVINFVFANEEANIDTARTLEGVIAHENTHTDIQEKFGLKTLFYSNWKIEGVCDYISQETSIYPDKVEEVLKKYHNQQSLNIREKYLIYKMQVEKLINEGKSIDDIINKQNEPQI